MAPKAKALAAAPPRSLDIPERQVLVRRQNRWHHTLLFYRTSEESVWVVARPDHSLEVVDLAQADEFRTVGRNEVLPAECRPLVLCARPTEEQLQSMRAEAHERVQVLGGPPPESKTGSTEAVWYFADSAVDSFGEPVPMTVMAKPTLVTIRGSSALVFLSDATPPGWTFAERVTPSDHSEWLMDKRIGTGRATQLSGVIKTSAQISVRMEAAWEKMKLANRNKSWVFRGPSAFKEIVLSAIASGMELPYFCAHFIQTSGMVAKSGLGVELTCWFNLLWYGCCFDLLDGLNLNCLEMASRRILQIQAAVHKSPRSPDFDGLDFYLTASFDSSLGVGATEFEQYMSNLAKDRALVMTQSRKLREEVVAEENRRNPKSQRPPQVGDDQKGGKKK